MKPMNLFGFADAHGIRIEISRIPAADVAASKIDGIPTHGPWRVSLKDVVFDSPDGGLLYLSTSDETVESAVAEFTSLIRGRVISACPFATGNTKNVVSVMVPMDISGVAVIC
jgi:hypothetical protein